MLISDIINKERVSALVVSELKELGVKHRKEKKVKICPEKTLRKRIFRTHLHLLELTDVVLSNGGIVQIPQFVSEACQRILEQVETEGLFRKAGSSLRQRELRTNLESGLPLGKSYHVIDVANVLKSFFRELPEPLLSSGIQETLVRSILLCDGQVEAILMSCLLLPPLSINTLAFFMQFLHTVSLSANLNKMSIDNLAILFTPGLMPIAPDKTGIRLNNHVKIVKILIENAAMIGVLPENVLKKLNLPLITPPKETKKKKRRSGSLTRMFNGLRKMVGVIGSSENLENTPKVSNLTTPCLSKSAKKRKLSDNAGFSAKKKKEILDSMPIESRGILPDTPVCFKQIKKSRLSLGGKRDHNHKYQSSEKRWSIVGSNWANKREKNEKLKNSTANQLSPVLSMPCIMDFQHELKSDLAKIEAISESNMSYDENDKVFDSDYVRIPKSEYEAIKKRVTVIETRISQEFGTIARSLHNSSSESSSAVFDDKIENGLSGPERVLNKFERTIEETESISSSPTTDYLAKRLSRELKIKRSTGTNVFRSPSQRKIGSIRRRSLENQVRLSRNKTWHISSSARQTVDGNFISEMSFYPKNGLKRGRPNTLQTGLLPPVTVVKNEIINAKDKENWIAGDVFFDQSAKLDGHILNNQNDGIISSPEKNNVELNNILENVSKTPFQIETSTAKYVTESSTVSNPKTSMLPPTAIFKRTVTSKTPINKTHNSAVKKRIASTPTEETQNGRASIARLRAQNAGMVLAKAKLFDGLRYDEEILNYRTSDENRQKNSKFVTNKSKQLEIKKENKDNVNLNKVKRLKEYYLQSEHRTPRGKNSTSKQILKTQKLNTGKALLQTFVDEGQITTKGDKSKVTSIRNISNNHNLKSPISKNIPRKKKLTNIGSSPRRLNKVAR